MSNSGEGGGYGRPPKKSQFKPGQSGNPAGRPRKANRVGQAVDRAMRERVAITENGVRSRKPKLDVTIKQLVKQSVEGDRHAAKLLFDQMKSVEDETRAETAPPLSPEEFALFQQLVLRIQAAKAEPE